MQKPITGKVTKKQKVYAVAIGVPLLMAIFLAGSAFCGAYIAFMDNSARVIPYEYVDIEMSNEKK